MESKKSKKVFGVIVDVLLILVVIVAIVISVITFSSKASDNGVANVFGYSPFSVQSDSMHPVFEKGDLIISKTKDFDVSQIKVGDIITFRAEDITTGKEFINSHRVVKIDKLDEASDYLLFTTKGDNVIENDLTKVGSTEVLGIYSGKSIPKLGSVMDFLRTQTGFMICVLIPLALFFIWELYKFLTIVIARKNEKAAVAGISEEEKKRIAEEYLKNQANNEKTSDTENVNR